MSDYLVKLVDRALGTAAVVEPRPRSLHEPLAAAPLMPPEIEPPTEPPPEKDRVVSEPALRTIAVTRNVPPPPENAAAHDRAPATDLEDDGLLLPASEPTTPQADAVVAPCAAASHVVAEQTPNRREPTPIPISQRSLAPGRKRADKPVRPGTIAEFKPERLPLINDHDGDVRSPRASAAPTSLEPSDVHITIGRVDVRAVFAASPAAKKSPPAPAGPRLTLEEYMRRSRTRGEQ